jgi:uncharacterized cupin superfamily protein
MEGRVAFLLNGEWHEVGPGGTAFMPRSIVHTFKNVGDQPSRMLLTTTPSGIEKFLRAALRNLQNRRSPTCHGLLKWALSTGFISCRDREAAVGASGYSNLASRLI